MLVGDDVKNRKWATVRNRLLAMALTMHEQSLCQGCGQPVGESSDPDGPEYGAEDYECRGCAVLAEAGSADDKPGTKWYLDVTHRVD